VRDRARVCNSHGKSFIVAATAVAPALAVVPVDRRLLILHARAKARGREAEGRARPRDAPSLSRKDYQFLPPPGEGRWRGRGGGGGGEGDRRADRNNKRGRVAAERPRVDNRPPRSRNIYFGRKPRRAKSSKLLPLPRKLIFLAPRAARRRPGTPGEGKSSKQWRERASEKTLLDKWAIFDKRLEAMPRRIREELIQSMLPHRRRE